VQDHVKAFTSITNISLWRHVIAVYRSHFGKKRGVKETLTFLHGF